MVFRDALRHAAQRVVTHARRVGFDRRLAALVWRPLAPYLAQRIDLVGDRAEVRILQLGLAAQIVVSDRDDVQCRVRRRLQVAEGVVGITGLVAIRIDHFLQATPYVLGLDLGLVLRIGGGAGQTVVAVGAGLYGPLLVLGFHARDATQVVVAELARQYRRRRDRADQCVRVAVHLERLPGAQDAAQGIVLGVGDYLLAVEARRQGAYRLGTLLTWRRTAGMASASLSTMVTINYSYVGRTTKIILREVARQYS